MFRAACGISCIRTVLHRHCPIQSHIAFITQFSPNNAKPDLRTRPPCPRPPLPPPKPPRDESLFWGFVTFLVLSGAGIVAAKNSPEVRDFLSLYAPWIDDIVAVLYEENMTYEEFVKECIKNIKKYIEFQMHGKPQLKTSLPIGKPIPIAAPPAPEAKAEKGDDKEKEVKQEEVAVVEGTGELTCEPEPPPIVTQGICDIEKCFKELCEFVINNYDTAKVACAYYNNLVDETMTTFSLKGLKALHAAKKERKGLVKESLRNACNAIKRLDEMKRYLECGVQASKEEIENTKLIYKNCLAMQKAALIDYQLENDKALARDRQWKLVQEILEKYATENMCIYPELKYKEKKPHILGDTDILLYSTYRYVDKLNDDLSAACTALSERVNRAYDALPGTKEQRAARHKQVMSAVSKRKAAIDQELKCMLDAQKQRNDRHLKKALQKQQAKSEEILKLRLAEKEKEVTCKFNKLVADQVAAEKRVFAAQLADMAVKLGVVEEKLNARLKAERETRRSQELWAAGASLLEATKKGGPVVSVNKEIKAIEKASDGEDKLVLTVLNSIPPTVRETGVVPESTLKEKYKLMESTALKVALVEEEGGPMVVYALSWLQALLLFMKVPGIPQDEFEKPPPVPAKNLDTFDLLQRARFWIDKGNIAVALRYVGALQGASRMAAQQWHEAARAHLEVRQAAEAVLAHAAAMGLQYI